MAGEFRAFAAKGGIDMDTAKPQGGAFAQFNQRVMQRQVQRAQDGVNAAAKSFEEGSISLDEFKRMAETYRPLLGDEAIDGVISDTGAYGDQMSRNIFKAATAHYVPGDQFDTGAYKPENAAPVIEERKRDHRQESGEQTALGSYLTVYDGASGKNGGLYDAAKADKAKKELEQYILDTYKLPKDQGIDLVEWARQKYKSLDAIATADLKKRHELEHGMSLQKEYTAYENLSDEDKQTVAEMLRIEAGGKKAEYDRLTGNSGSFYTNSMVHMNEGAGGGPGYDAWKKYKDLEQQLKDKGVLTPEVKAFIDRADNYLKTNIETEEWHKRTQDDSISSNIASVLGKPGAAVQTAINTMGTNISNAVSGENKPVDVYAPENLGSNVVNTIRGTTSEMILGDDPGNWQKVLDKGYQLLMSTADSALTIPMSFIPTVGPALAAGTMAVEAGSDTVLDASRRGGSAGQALAAGILAGTAEALFEKVSIGELIKTAKSSPKGFLNLVKSTLVNMGVNASEETFTEISNIITDTLVMQDLSNYHLTVAQYISEGLSREEAENKAKLGLVWQVTEAGLGGAIQGGFMSGVGNTVGYVRDAAQTRAAGDSILHTAGGADALLAEAVRFPDNAAVQKAAEKVRQKGTGASMGNLAYELQQQTGRSMGNIINAYNKNATQAHIPAHGAGEAVSNAARFTQAGRPGAGLVYDAYAADALNSGVANRLNTVAQMLGKRVRFADSVRGGTANAQISGNEVLIEKNNPNPVQFLLGHELTHGIQQDAPAEYQAFRDCIAEDVQEEAQALQRVYQTQGVNIDYDEALDEATANYAGRLIEDTNVLDRFIQRNREKRSVLQKIRDAIRKLLQKLTGAERRMAQTAEGRLAAALDAASRQVQTLEVNQNANQEAVAKYSIDPDFARVYDAWNGIDASHQIKVGSTSEALESIGVDSQSIWWDFSKIKRIKKQHPQMTDDVIKQVPNILENPILIMESQTVPGRLTLFGEVYDAASAPVLAVLELNPTDKNGHSLDIIKIASAYGKDTNPQRLIDKSRILYVDPNKNRTDSWLTVNRLQLPLPSSSYGSIDTITPGNTGVNSQSMPEEQKYSLKGSEDARSMAETRRENAELKKKMEHYRGQLKRSEGITTDKEAVYKAARSLIREYNADIDASEITGDLQKLYDYIANGQDESGDLNFEEVHRRAKEIGGKVVENALYTDDENYRQYSDLRAYLREHRLVVSKEDARNMPGFEDFRRENFGRLNINSQGETNIDQVYGELSELWPEYFDEQREINPIDQLMRISEVAEDIYDISEGNPFSPYMDEAAGTVANEIIDTFFELPQAKPTFADRQAQKLDEAKRLGRQRMQKALEKQRRIYDNRIEKIKTRHKGQAAAGRERRRAKEQRAKIIRHSGALSKKLLHPSDQQHIPEKLRPAAAALLGAINQESAYSVDPQTGKHVKDGSGRPTQRTEKARELRLAYAEILKDNQDSVMVVDPDLMDNLNEIEAMKDIPLSDMNLEQLQTVWAAIRAIESSIRTAGEMLGKAQGRAIADIANGIRMDNLDRQDRGNYKGALGKAQDLITLDMYTPQTYFHQLGPTGETLFSELRGAQDQEIRYLVDYVNRMQEITDGSKIQKLEKEIHTIRLSNRQELKASTAQIMELYASMKREQARNHILADGIRLESIKDKGLKESRSSTPVRVSETDLANIMDVLTEDQKKTADQIQAYMANDLSELGNKASMELYGYRKFTAENYYPIRVDKNQTRQDIAKDAQATTIVGRGFTKAVNPKATNALMIGSIFETCDTHAKDMIAYGALAPAMENMRRIFNYRYRDADGILVGSVKSDMEKVFGKNGPSYFSKLMEDINRGGGLLDRAFTDKLMSNYKAASVGWNARVVLQQPTAILRALSEIDIKYLVKGVFGKSWEEAKKYSAIAQWKEWGGYDVNSGRQLRDLAFGSESKLEKLKNFSMALAGKADSITWSRLWNAVKAEVRDTHPHIKPGTELFYQTVAERFNGIIDRTQVVDGVLQRSQIMRSSNALNKVATSFMAEPTKTYNMFVNALYDLRHARGPEAKKKAKGALIRSSFALVSSFAVNAVAQSIMDAWRDDDKEKNYWERFAGHWIDNFLANFNPAGYVPYAKDILSIFQGYDVTRMDMEPISKLVTSSQNLLKAFSGDGRYTVYNAGMNLAGDLSRLFGIPLANLRRDTRAVVFNLIVKPFGGPLMEYKFEKAMYDLGFSGNSGRFNDILKRAKKDDPEAYKIIFEDMWDKGFLGEKRVFKREVPDYVTFKKQRYILTPEQKKRYGEIMGMPVDRYYEELAKRAIYQNMDHDEKEKLAESIYSYLSSVAKAAVVDEYEASDTVTATKLLEDAGISAADQLLIKATADTDGNDSVSDKEYRQALWNSTMEQWEQNLLLQMRKAQRTKNKDLRKEKMENVVKAQGK